MSSNPSSSSDRLISSSSTLFDIDDRGQKVYKAYLHHSPSSNTTETSGENGPVLLKYRFHKQYRHPSLDASLTRSRIAGEARALIKCLRAGVHVPGVRMVDVVDGLLAVEWVEGGSVRHLLPGGAEGEGDEEANGVEATDPLLEYGISRDILMTLIGTEIAKMHKADIIHGDLTTSNMMLRHPSSVVSTGVNIQTELVLIDFGLAYYSGLVEDKAVDLYVLERAFSSTHPDSEPLFASVLKAYGEQTGKEWTAIQKRLEDGDYDDYPTKIYVD